MILIPADWKCRKIEEEEIEMLLNILVFQFDKETFKIFELIDSNKIDVCFSSRTKRIRAFLYNNKILATVRASDFYLVPHIELGVLLHKILPFPKRRVVIVNEIVEDVFKGNSIFAKHIITADQSIKSYDEVLVVNEDDKLICLGRALLDYETMITATRGVAVQIREKLGEKL